jgi:uncharacterized protein (TIGR03663 family)
MTKKAFFWLFSVAFLTGLLFRVTALGLRPMHHDEANQALKFGALLEQGEYRYDRTDHHGPSLYYLTWPFARLLAGGALASQSEKTLRLVPVCFGLATILLFLLFLPSLGRPAVILSALGLALSPAFVYFSRFYIQETLLVFFLTAFLASLWRYVLQPAAGWALGIGFFAGMMYTTKETSVIAFAAAAAALLLTAVSERKKKKDRERGTRKSREASEHCLDERGQGEAREPKPRKGGQKSGARFWHLFVAFGAWLLVTFLLFSSFLQNPKGIIDSVVSFKIYFVRASESAFHIQPWHYYLKLLAFSRPKGGPIWSEAFLLALALAGSAAAFRTSRNPYPGRSFLKFIFFYTVTAMALFSFIPYKTPWNLLSFHLGFILLAGAGAAIIVGGCRKIGCRAGAIVLLTAGFSHLGWQSYRANFVLPADPANPYVYAQTSPGFLKLVRRVEDIASVHPEGRKMLIKVVAGPYETWPLPWSLRKFERVGYWQKAGEVSLSDRPALVIASAEEATVLEPFISAIYRSEYYELRPNVLLVLFVRTDLWEDYLKSRPGE